MTVRKYMQADEALVAKLETLIGQSAQSDGFITDIDPDTSMNVQKDMPCLFTMEDEEQLHAVLYVFAPGRDETEINILVHRESRNKGCFRLLLNEAVSTCSEFGYDKGLFVCRRNSESGQNVIKRWGCVIDHAELQMRCETPTCSKNNYNDIEIVNAQKSDIEELAILGAAAFCMDSEFEKEIIKNTLAAEKRTQYIAKRQGVMVGLCSACEDSGRMMIFGLGVHPDERRKGYARALLESIALEAAQKGIRELTLDVDEDNAGAIALYESFGFKVTGCTEYYRLLFDAFRK